MLAALRNAFLLSCVLLIGAVSARPTVDPTQDSGPGFKRLYPAPYGAWTCEGGSPGRTRTTRTRAPSRRPDLTWTFEPRGEVVGEPVVWGDSVLVEVLRPDRLRALHLLDRETGEERGGAILTKSELPLAPTVFGGTVVLRMQPEELAGFAVTDRGLRRTWRHGVDAPLGRPLATEGGGVFETTRRELIRIELGAREPTWRATGNFSGPLAIAAQPGTSAASSVYSLAAFPQPGGNLVRLASRAATDGALLSERWVAQYQGSIGVEDGSIVTTWRGAAIRFPRPFTLGGQSHTSVFVEDVLEDVGDDLRVALPYFATDPVPLGHGFAGLIDEAGGERYWALGRHMTEVSVLLDPQGWPDFDARTYPPAATADLLYLAGLAVDPETRKVRWGLPTPGTWIPVLDGVLVVRGDRSAVEGWMVSAPEGRPLDWAGLASTSAVLERAQAVTAAEVLRGDFRLVRDGVEWQRGRSSEVLDLERVWMLLDGDDLAWGASVESVLEGIDALARFERRERFEKIAKNASRIRDPYLLRELLSLGPRLGVDDDVLERVRTAEERLLSRSSRIDADSGAKDRARLEADRGLVREQRLAWLERCDALETEDAITVRELQYGLLERLLEEDPADSAAAAWIEAALPTGLTLERPENAGDWLRYLRALARTEVEVAPLADFAATIDAGTSDGGKRLARASVGWRDDLMLVGSPNILIATPLERPGEVASMLARGEALCAALAGWFAGYDSVRERLPRLEILLFESEQEYLDQSSSQGGHARLSWTAGHYDLIEKVSRFYAPSLDSAGWDGALEVFLHELTHHWLDQRCPAFVASARNVGKTDQGFWIVEGFASFAESLDFDPRTGAPILAARLGDRLPMLAVVEPKDLIDWEELVAIKPAELPRLVGKRPVRAPALQDLGSVFEVDRAGMFYAQSAVLARYLFEADGGAQRQALLDYLVAYYQGQAEGLDFERVFGASPAEVGGRARAWALAEVDRALGRR
ncbi:MAG: hypothetical protein AAFZ65_05935 [Planctomycetota bacterium]